MLVVFLVAGVACSLLEFPYAFVITMAVFYASVAADSTMRDDASIRPFVKPVRVAT